MDSDRPVIKGDKVTLLPISEYELPVFIKLHMEDKDSKMGRYCLKDYNIEQARFYITSELNNGNLFIWTVYTRSIPPVFVGFIYLNDVNAHKASIHGIMDTSFAKKVAHRRDKKISYSTEAFRNLISYCFSKGLHRIETDVAASNKFALTLDKKIGFREEGRMRHAVVKQSGYDDLVLLSILKEEWNG